MNSNLKKFYTKHAGVDDKFANNTSRVFSILFNIDSAEIPKNVYIDEYGNKVVNFDQRTGRGTTVTNTTTTKIVTSNLNYIIGLSENTINRYPVEDFNFVIRNINLPNMKISDGDELTLNSSNSNMSTYSIPGKGTIEPESDSFSIEFINTVESPIEGFFIPWMEEVMCTRNNLNVPFRRATVHIFIYNENQKNINNMATEDNIKYEYIISGCYPNFCDTPNLSHESANEIRTVGFKFNKINVISRNTKSTTPYLEYNKLSSRQSREATEEELMEVPGYGEYIANKNRVQNTQYNAYNYNNFNNIA